MRNTLPFDMTPQIKRYLNELLYNVKNYPSGEHDCVIDTFSQGEKKTEYSLNNAIAFLKYMENEGIIKYSEDPKSYTPLDYDDEIISDIKHKNSGYPEKWRAHILNKELIESIAEFASGEDITSQGKSKVRWNYITGKLSYSGYGIKPKIFRKEKNRKMFNTLWNNKEHIIQGKTESVGNRKKTIDVANEFEFIQNSRLEEYNDRGIEQTINFAKDIVKSARDKGFDISLSQNEGLLMTLRE